MLFWTPDNLLANGGFEDGPHFLSNSSDGILLEPAPSPIQSPLSQFSIIGTVKYIDSKHFSVPQGNAAIEIVSVSSGIQTATKVIEGSTYSLTFTLGDANDGCKGDFIIGVQAGSVAQNITLHSAGTGSSKKFSLTFKADSGATPITFLSLTSHQNRDGIFCGPVVDDVVLSDSSGSKSSEVKWIFLIFLLLAILWSSVRWVWFSCIFVHGTWLIVRVSCSEKKRKLWKHQHFVHFRLYWVEEQYINLIAF